MFGLKANAGSTTANNQQEVAARAPVSTTEIRIESLISSVRVVSERATATTLVYSGSNKPAARSVIHVDATIKDVEVIIDQQDPRHVTIITY